MKKIIILIAIALYATSCTTTSSVVDKDFFKNELNESIQEGFDIEFRVG